MCYFYVQNKSLHLFIVCNPFITETSLLLVTFLYASHIVSAVMVLLVHNYNLKVMQLSAMMLLATFSVNPSFYCYTDYYYYYYYYYYFKLPEVDMIPREILLLL